MKEKNQDSLIFTKTNYIIMGVGVVLILLGFFLMSGGKTENPAIFNGEEIFSFTRITLAPIVIILGFIVVFYSILKKEK